jgi:hypothetical protein
VHTTPEALFAWLYTGIDLEEIALFAWLYIGIDLEEIALGQTTAGTIMHP